MNVKGWTSSANWAILRNQFTGNGETSGEVSEWLKDLVSKTSSGFILLVGSNPTLSVNNRAVVALIRSSTARLFTERVALGARELDAMCTRVAGARQSQQPQRGTFVVCTFVVPALRLRIADFQRVTWRAMAFEVGRWKFESSRVGWLGWELRLRWSWVGRGAVRARRGMHVWRGRAPIAAEMWSQVCSTCSALKRHCNCSSPRSRAATKQRDVPSQLMRRSWLTINAQSQLSDSRARASEMPISLRTPHSEGGEVFRSRTESTARKSAQALRSRTRHAAGRVA